MATFSEALKDLINSVAGVTALIGALPTMRYYPVRLPTATTPVYPAITYQSIDDTSVYAHSGYSGLINIRVQLTIWSKTYASGELVTAALRAGLNAFVGVVSGVEFDRIFIEGGITDFEETTQIHQRTLDLLIGYVG